MLVRCWGARGSIPVSGPKYLKYGGNTTCLEIITKDNRVLIVDAGSGIREAGNALLAQDRHDYTLLLTHAHWDHIMGFPFFKPLYSSRTKLSVWGRAFVQKSIKNILSRPMMAPNFPVDFSAIRADISYKNICHDHYELGAIKIFPIALSHPNQGTGFKFVEDGKCFVFLTDNELGYHHEGGLDHQQYLGFCRSADLLIHDAEYNKDEYKKTRGWGHSTYDDALNLAIEAGVKKFGLFHHNQDRFDEEIDAMVDDCEKIKKSRGANLECFAVRQSMEFKL
ncbi:MAG TPA: MBL fold metallo-hydrolase [Smithellaceae bacterium]|nr:MBL fold metallo-hydrolase [Smithellaceae bacterium]HPY35824.1 MBL fold metallo-hydrolase [Smithellaceae bacterium]